VKIENLPSSKAGRGEEIPGIRHKNAEKLGIL
jgi:hypothetical protein